MDRINRPSGGTGLSELKQEVRRFYDSVGWKQIGEGIYQNAQYEDLRNVSREYIHRCHMRVKKFLPGRGKYLLDAGSGPIQYPEYLEYSNGFNFRVCLDISQVALEEARLRIADRGLFVIGDIASLPFRDDVFEGVVSLHAIHHLPEDEQPVAFKELLRTLGRQGSAAIVYSWGSASRLMRLFRKPIEWTNSFAEMTVFKSDDQNQNERANQIQNAGISKAESPSATFTFKHSFKQIMQDLAFINSLEVRSWRSVSTTFLRTFMHEKLLGRLWLRIIFALEDIFPHFLGRYGQYPLFLFTKPADKISGERHS